ncbi:MAG: flagellar assembly protein T N-terminal domain-containing protein [Deltaproteobacteria bacterium]|nr:flagellar assembly protein T N-terminal domain-containing protein [Deltaproteobacteria bacterium]
MTKNLTRVTIPALIVTLLTAISVVSAEEKDDIRSVKASGSAMIVGGDIEKAKKEAIFDAKRNAVEQVGSQVIAKTVVENFDLVKDKIITRVDGYVHSYDILEEKPAEKSYQVKIEARVSKSALIDDAALIYNDMEKPRLMIVVSEVRGKEIFPTSQAENAISEFFVEKGFTLVDQATARENIKKDELRKIAEGDEKAAVKAGLRAGAEAVVIGTATMGDVESVKDVLYASKSTVSIRALRTDNASLYAVSNKTESAADGVADAAQRKALDTSSKSAARDIFWKIVKKWNDEKMMGSDIEVMINGVGFSELKKVLTGLKETNGVKEVIQRSFDAPTAVLNITYQGDAVRLAEVLSETKFKGFSVEILSVSSGKINMKIK